MDTAISAWVAPMTELTAAIAEPPQIAVPAEISVLVRELSSSFLPSHHEVHIITVEHNYTAQRSRIHGLLTSWGYSRVFEELSMYDDWYIKK